MIDRTIGKEDVVYIVAVRIEPSDPAVDQDDAIQVVQARVLNALRGEADHGKQRSRVHVLVRPLGEMYSLGHGDRHVGNAHEKLRDLGFDFEVANEVVPVATESSGVH